MFYLLYRNFISKYLSNKQRIFWLRKQGMRIGENCELFRDVSFGSEPYLITIGNNVKITSGAKLITHDGGIYVLRNLGLLKNADDFGEIVIGNNVFIGNNVIILPKDTPRSNSNGSWRDGVPSYGYIQAHRPLPLSIRLLYKQDETR